MATREDIKGLIAYLALAFSNFHPDVTSPMNIVDLFMDILGDLPADSLKAALRSYCSEDHEFAPMPGQIRSRVVEMLVRAAGVPTSGEAWGVIIGSYERMPGGNMAGGGHSPILDNPLVVEAVKELGGYTADLYENQMANRAHFFKIYEVLYDQVLRDKGQLPIVRAYIEANKQDTRLLERGL